MKEEAVVKNPRGAYVGRFLYMFVGSGSFSAAVHELAGGFIKVLSMPGAGFSDVNVASDRDFEMLLDEIALWRHMAPPCKSLTKAIRKDQFA